MNKRLPNILVVEDDIDVQDSICEILEINGFVTRRANNVKNAIVVCMLSLEEIINYLRFCVLIPNVK